MQGVCLLSSLACSDTVLVQERSVGSPGTCAQDAHEEDGSAGSSHRRPKFPSGSSALTSSIGPAHEEPTPATFTWHSVAQEN